MYFIVYISSAIGSTPDIELEKILKISRINNKKDNITGLLLYHDFSFFQVLEGPRQAVLNCFSKIQKDPRHTNILQLRAEPITARNFSDWHMAYAPFDSMTLEHQSGFMTLKRLGASKKIAEMENDPKTYNYVHTFIDTVADIELGAS